MDGQGTDKKYKSVRIPVMRQPQGEGAMPSNPKLDAQRAPFLSDGVFYEIEYDSGSIPGVGKFRLNTQAEKVSEPEKDEIRELFVRMRDIARAYRPRYDYSKFFDRRVPNDDAVIFRRQGLFMEDFTDDYEGSTPFSRYFPHYQMMGYEQLRTYFTWRTRVRNGIVSDISLSYAFVYIYELLGNIGAADPQDGLEKLMSFWRAFREFDKTVDRYIICWLKDYHIYYELPQTFEEFVTDNGLAGHYPNLAKTDDDFNLFCAISKYKIKKMHFFTEDTRGMISDCFSFVMDRIKRDFTNAGLNFDGAFFRPTRKTIEWKPFKDALFHPWVEQPDRQVILSENEIYLCKNNEWAFGTAITSEKGRQFIGYVMKQMDSDLRKITKYRYKLSASTDMINEDTLRALAKAGLFIDRIVSAAVLEYHREMTKTIVTVNSASLSRIREEALVTQESLIVEEHIQQANSAPTPLIFPVQDQNIFTDTGRAESASTASVWDDLKDALNKVEIKALGVILHDGDIKAFADECNIMIEVLVDSINEKAMDFVGDSLMDEDFVLHDEYKRQIGDLLK